jgi:exopolysaccharide production protein ExoZ
MFFYFIFGLCLFFPLPIRLPALVLTFFSLLAIGQWILTENPLLITYTDKILLEFLAGIIIGSLYIRGIALNATLAYVVMIASVILLIGFETTIFPVGARIIVWGIPAILLVIATLSLECVGNIRQHYLLQMIGDASYSIYLSHIFTIELVEFFWRLLGWQTDSLATQMMFVANSIGASALVGILVLNVIERPSLKLLRPLWRPTNPKVTTV